MPISASQHRTVTGCHQTTQPNPYLRTTTGRSVCPMQPTHRSVMLPLADIKNTPSIAIPSPSPQHVNTNPTATFIRFMLLLNHVHIVPYPLTVSQQKILTLTDTNGDNVGSSVMNSLQSISNFIAQHDPIQFPEATATPLCRGSHQPDDFVHYMNSQSMNVIARGLDQLRCLEKKKFHFLKGTVHNSIKLINAALRQLTDPNNPEMTSLFMYSGLRDIPNIKPRFITLCQTLRAEIKDILFVNKNAIYYGYGSAPETEKTYAMVQINDKKRQILLTDYFFGLCTVQASRVLLHEMSHFHSKIDLFQVLDEKSCHLSDQSEDIPIHAQLDDNDDFYRHSINTLREENIVTEEHMILFYQQHKTEFVNTFNTNKTIQEEAIFLNADSISHFILLLANWGFKKKQTMPLQDLSKFQTELDIQIE